MITFKNKLNVLARIVTYFFDNTHYNYQSLWFKRALYLFVVIKSIYWLAYFDLLFGTHSMIYPGFRSTGRLNDLAFVLFKYPQLSLLFTVVAFLLSGYRLFFQKSHYFLGVVSDLLLWFIVVNIHNNIYPTLSGGNFLLNQFLFFNTFLLFRQSDSVNLQDQLKTIFHNVAALGVVIQIMLLYFLSGLAKLLDADWLSGNGVFYAMQIKHFTLFTLPASGVLWLGVTKFLNYLVMIYQLGFPFLVWIQKIKKPFLLLGVIMHGYIAIFMGLPDFGYMMLISYLFFWPFKNKQA